MELEKLIDRGVLRGQDGLLQLRMILEIGRRQFQFETRAFTEPIADQQMARILCLGVGAERQSLTRFRNLKRDGRRKGLWDWRYIPGAGQSSCYTLTIENWATALKARPLHGRANDGAPVGLPRRKPRRPASDVIELNAGVSSSPLNAENAVVGNCGHVPGQYGNNRSTAEVPILLGDGTSAWYSVSFRENLKDILGPHCKRWRIPLKAVLPKIASYLEAAGAAAGVASAAVLENFEPFIAEKFEQKDRHQYKYVTGGLLLQMVREFEDVLELEHYNSASPTGASKSRLRQELDNL